MTFDRADKTLATASAAAVLLCTIMALALVAFRLGMLTERANATQIAICGLSYYEN